MIIETGNIWDYPFDLLLFTSANVVNKQLDMSHGFASQVVERHPHIGTYTIQEALGGVAVKRGIQTRTNLTYGCLIPSTYPAVRVGAFQTKWTAQGETEIALVRKSAEVLDTWARMHPTQHVFMNCPRINKEYLTIFHELKHLPDNVHIWTLTPWYQRPHYDLLEGLEQNEINHLLEMSGGMDLDHWFYGMWMQYNGTVEDVSA